MTKLAIYSYVKKNNKCQLALIFFLIIVFCTLSCCILERLLPLYLGVIYTGIFLMMASYFVNVSTSDVVSQGKKAVLAFCIMFHLLFGNYVYGFTLGCIFILLSVFSSLKSNTQNGQKGHLNIFMVDLKVIDTHFREDFSMFFALRQTNLIGVLLCACYTFTGLNKITGEVIETSVFIIVFFWVVGVVLSFVRYQIICYANTPVVGINTQKFLTLFGGAAATFGLGGLGLHVTTDTYVVGNIPILGNWYGTTILGLKYKTIGCSDKAAVAMYEAAFPKNDVPVDDFGFVSRIKIRQELGETGVTYLNKGKEGVRFGLTGPALPKDFFDEAKKD